MAAPSRRKPTRQPPTEHPPAQADPVAASVAPPASDPAPASHAGVLPKFRPILLGVVWAYVAALWLLALDQTFNWGIFGSKLPPLP